MRFVKSLYFSRYTSLVAGFMAKGGVGFYPMKNFIHLDTGDKRQWIVNNKNQLKMLDN